MLLITRGIGCERRAKLRAPCCVDESSMRPFLLTILGLLLLTPSHVAANSFEGGYAGIHIGFRWADMELDTPAYQFKDAFGGTVQIPARSETISLDGVIGGGHFGYNVVQATNWLFGVEADIDFGNSSKTTSFSTSRLIANDNETPPIISQQNRISSLKIGWQGTLRTRFGFIQDNWLFYSTAGIAFMQADWTETITSTGGGSQTVEASELLTGWVVGGGIESFVDVNTIARIEYLYEDFGPNSIPLPFTSSTGELSATAHKLRVGLSWTF